MKYNLLLAALLSLAACGSPDAPGTANAPAMSGASTNPDADPRIAQIRELHGQLLTFQKSFAETEQQLVPLAQQVERAKNSDMLQKDKELPERKREFAELISTSQNIEATINQLDQSKSHDAAQAQLVGESLERSKAIVVRAADLVEKNKGWIAFFEKTAAFRNGQKSK